MSKFIKGQKVIVTNKGRTHDTAIVWIKETIYYNNWTKDKLPNNGDVGIILDTVSGSEVYYIPVYFVRIHNSVYMINELGLSAHREESKQTLLSFSGIREKYAVLFSDPYFSIDMIGDHFEVNYGHEWCDCKTEYDLVCVLDALVILQKFKHQGI